MPDVEGVLLDIDGVLTTSWEPIPGSVEAVAAIRAAGLPICLITNTTTHPRAGLAAILGDAGFAVRPGEIVTAVTATAAYLRHALPGAHAFVLSDGDAGDDLEGVKVVDDPAEADVIVLGGASDRFAYPTVTAVFRRLMEGVPLVAMHRNLYWKTERGFELDAGAYVLGLEAATGAPATVCGKPAASYFQAALDVLGVPAARAAMVGDDIANDVEGARAVGITGVLVRTGKYRPGDETRGEPDVVLGSLGDLLAWLGMPG
jgi:HAD superfamily hydrolase (TIGR01458 family)